MVLGDTSEWSHPEKRELGYLHPSAQQSLVEDRLWGAFWVSMHQTKLFPAARKPFSDKDLVLAV